MKGEGKQVRWIPTYRQFDIFLKLILLGGWPSAFHHAPPLPDIPILVFFFLVLQSLHFHPART